MHALVFDNLKFYLLGQLALFPSRGVDLLACLYLSKQSWTLYQTNGLDFSVIWLQINHVFSLPVLHGLYFGTVGSTGSESYFSGTWRTVRI